jgi:hypothetical protein
MRRTLLALLGAIGLVLVTALPANAYEPVNVVHTEHVQVGPYGMTVGFSTWPIRALQSLDFTFAPDGGVDDKSGTLTTIGATGSVSRPAPLARHPRKRDVWGLDVKSLKTSGDWTFRFAITGPQGSGVGELKNLQVLEQPGPPMALSWSISSVPLIALVGFLGFVWRRTRPRLRPSAA